jgi:predicted TIM-barrel fold metal-dependent hydrolase
VAFKSIVAYRTGLSIQPTPSEDAERCFREIKKNLTEHPHTKLRLAHKALNDYIVLKTLSFCSTRRVPLQLHTGMGDADVDLLLANPLHLRWILHNKEYREAPIVLLHAAYPYSREAGYPAATYKQVYVDFGESIPQLSVSGMRFSVSALLEQSPSCKIMYSSDAAIIPERFYLGAKWCRKVLAEVLDSSIATAELSPSEALQIGSAVLRDNAIKLYSL